MSLPLASLNALTATAQFVANGAYTAARLRVEHAAETVDPVRRARHISEAIQWQQDGAELSAKARAHFAADNLIGGAS